MSSKGNLIQQTLFTKWGGAPTTLILRHSNNELDKFDPRQNNGHIVPLKIT